MPGRIRRAASGVKRAWTRLRLPAAAKAAVRADHAGTPSGGPDLRRAMDLALAWLASAQDRSASRDGGIARDFHWTKGWGRSYPETTGYWVPTALSLARRRGLPELRIRARRMLDWLAAVQLPDGAFPGGTIGLKPVVPVSFNTGQILLGLAAGVEDFGPPDREPLRRAADWLCRVQDPDGAWRRHPSPFALPGAKAYDAHAAWGLLEADRVDGGRGYAEKALANIRWATGRQRSSGWFEDCCLEDPERPLTHTLGYALRGIIEGFAASGKAEFLASARAAATGLLSARRSDGSLPGRIRPDWSPAADWSCVTGDAQISACWLRLAALTGEPAWESAARDSMGFILGTILTEGPEGVRGGIKGSHPLDGGYNPFSYPNWAAKFFLDAAMLLEDLPSSKAGFNRPGLTNSDIP